MYPLPARIDSLVSGNIPSWKWIIPTSQLAKETQKAPKNEPPMIFAGLFFSRDICFPVSLAVGCWVVKFMNLSPADVIAACDMHGGGPRSAASEDHMPCAASFVEW